MPAGEDADFDIFAVGSWRSVIFAVTDALAPIQTRTAELLDDTAELERVLADGAGRAREVAAPTLSAVYDRIGFLPAGGGTPA